MGVAGAGVTGVGVVGAGVMGVVTLGGMGAVGAAGVGLAGAGVALVAGCAPFANLMMCSTIAASGCPFGLANFAAARQVVGTGVPAVQVPVA